MLRARFVVKYPQQNRLGLSFSDIEKSINDVLAILKDIRPIISTVNKSRGEIEQIITVVAKNSKELETIINSVSKIAPTIDVTVKQIQPLVTPHNKLPGGDPNDTSTDVGNIVSGVSWFARHPGVVITGGTLLLSGVLLSGIYAATQLPKVFRREG